MKVLSLGAGVQSSALALMAAGEEIDRPECAIFADTQWEPLSVYAWLSHLEKHLPFPVHRVTVGNIRAHLINGINSTGQKFTPVPFFQPGHKMGRRQCTREYKLAPITKKLRDLGYGPKNPVDLMIGISLEEIFRLKPNRIKWITNVWPLVDRRMTRADCIEWLRSREIAIPPKSSCIGCPYHAMMIDGGKI